MENKKLKRELESKEATLLEAINRNRELANKLIEFNKKIIEQDKLIDNLKKSLDSGEKAYHHQFSTKIIKLALDLYG